MPLLPNKPPKADDFVEVESFEIEVGFVVVINAEIESEDGLSVVVFLFFQNRLIVSITSKETTFNFVNCFPMNCYHRLRYHW